MTATLPDVAAKKKQAEQSAEQQAAAKLVRLAKEQGLSLTGRTGCLSS
jgi:putative transposase